MEQQLSILDLSATFTPPLPDAPPGVVASIALECEKLGLSHAGDLLIDPLTQREREDLLWYLEEYHKWPYEGFFERARHVEALLPELGRRFYQMLFGSVQAKQLFQTWLQHTDMPLQISIMSDIPVVLSLPWELLHDEQGFLVLRSHPSISLVRRFPLREATTLPVSFDPPLRVLMVTARPDGIGFIDPRSIASELFNALEEHIDKGEIALEFLRPPILRDLKARLEDGTQPPIHVLHFDGHGVFDEEGKQGMLCFEDRAGRPSLVSASDLATVLKDNGLRLVVLTACQSARVANDDIFSSVASRLIQSGIDTVVAMSASVLVTTAKLYVRVFYQALSSGISASTAHEKARQALHDNPRRHLYHRYRDREGSPVVLQDWWLLHFYQQRPLTLRPIKVNYQNQQYVSRLKPRLNQDMPSQPRYSFYGRVRELHQLERWLIRKKLVVIYGLSGTGKTALAREAADWFTRTHLYTGACFVSFEHGGDAAMLLGRMGDYLEIRDGLYDLNDYTAALKCLRQILETKSLLVIADNMESILPGGKAPLEEKGRTQLWNVLLELVQMGAGVVLTSRSSDFGDERLATEGLVADLAVNGLHPEDASDLAVHLLDDLGINRKRLPYAELRDLLHQLDYHPLALQLILPYLKTYSPSTIQSDLGALLRKEEAADVDSRLPLASLDYSLQHLSREQREMVQRLAIFENGALEDYVLMITEIPEEAWNVLRPTLEQTGLLTTEQIHTDMFNGPFLHFHPLFCPFLRHQREDSYDGLRNRHMLAYVALALMLYHLDQANQQERTLVWQELPNLRRALSLLLEAEQKGVLQLLLETEQKKVIKEVIDAEGIPPVDDIVATMAHCMAYFFTSFGLNRERDELHRHSMIDAASPSTQPLTYAQYLYEYDQGTDEHTKGNVRAAYRRFEALLGRIQASPQGAKAGRGSYEHCLVLEALARCLSDLGQPAPAEEYLRKAQALLDRLVKQRGDDPGELTYIVAQFRILTDLGDVLRDQGRYEEAREAYEQSLRFATRQAGQQGQSTVLAQLGLLALRQGNLNEAASFYCKALDIARTLNIPHEEAGIYHQLGTIALRQHEIAQAEQYLKESLRLCEYHGDQTPTIQIYSSLGITAVEAGRFSEAEGWLRQAVERDKQLHNGSPTLAQPCLALAIVLLSVEQAGHRSRIRLMEAREYAEQARLIREKQGGTVPIGEILSVLATLDNLLK